MKTYEEMARDVLKRRDEELQKLEQLQQISQNNAPPEAVYPASAKKRGLLPRIAIPCTAAITAAAVGICVWNNIPQRAANKNNLAAETDQDKLDYIYDAFNSHKYEDPIIPVTFESVYKGGKTEININKAEIRDVYPFSEMSSIRPDMPRDEDFISIADERINSYYGMEFDRLSTVFENWKSEHEPFGYYNCDTETSDMVEHSAHVYHTLNLISYTTDGGIRFSVSASFNKLTAAVENARSSVINGFDAMVYQLPNGVFVVDIDMGATVRIHASRVHKDTLIKIIDAYTKPRAELTKISFEEINILDEMPAFLLENDPFAAESTDGCEIKNIDAEYANKYYNMEFDRLGKLHKDWYEDGKNDLKIYFRFEDTLVKDVCEINTLSYGTPAEGVIKVSANIGSVPEPETDPGYSYHSYINGHYAVIYRSGRTGCELGAMIEFGGTVVEFSAVEFTEEDFINVLKEYTAPDTTIKIHNKAPEFFEAENPFKMPDTPNLDSCDFKQCTIEQLNDYYGIEFDRLTRLHKDWKEWHADYDDGLLGVYTDPASGKIVYARNYINYQLPNGAFIDVTAKFGGELPLENWNGFNNTTEYETTYSTINGYMAMLSRTGFAGDGYDDMVYPNGDHKFGAVIIIGNTLVHIKTAGLTEEEFLAVLDEYTK